MVLDFFNSITLLSLFLTIVLSFFFFISRKGNRSQNRILASLLFLFCLQIVYSFMVSNNAYQYFLGWHKSIYFFRQTALLTGPLIYFYLNLASGRKSFLKPNKVFHILPFVGVAAFLTVFYAHQDRFIIWKSDINLYDTILILLQNLVYIVLSVFTLRSERITFKTFLRNISESSHVVWLQMLLLGFMVIWIVNLDSFAIVTIYKGRDWCAYTGSIYALTVFLFMNCLMFLLLLKPEIYYVIEKYKRSSMDEAGKREYLRRLVSYMESRKPYLNPDVSLKGLAEHLSMNPRTLSQIINESFKKNFKEYINEYRLRESMRILSDASNSQKTVLEILYDVGFNSKSVFNHQFKRYTGETPQEYRSKHCSGLSEKLETADSLSPTQAI